MRPEDIARKYRNLHSGYRLIGYAEAGLPLTELSLTAYTIEYKPLSPVFEFTLKSIRAGINSREDISSFLGFDSEFMIGVLSELIRSEDVYLSGEGIDVRQRLKLTAKGSKVLDKAELELPVEQTIQIVFDRVQGKPIVLFNERRFFPRDIRDYGWLEIPAIPARRIVLDDLDIQETQRAIDRIGRSAKAPRRVLLAIRELGKQVNKFRHAIALRYQNEHGDDRISFAIDGIVNPDLEAAFLAKDGIGRIRLDSFDQAKVDNGLHAELERLKENIADNNLVASLEEEEQLAHDAVSEAESKTYSPQSDEGRAVVGKELAAALDVLDNAKKRLRTAARIRNLSVYDHPSILDDALKNSERRLMIISPWIRTKVVNNAFIRDVESLLKKGVEVFIGYGIGDDKGDSLPMRKLSDLANKYTNMQFREFGDTHAKVLLSDSRFYVVGSFNWLSFKGDPTSTFRDEQSILVSVPELIEEKYQDQIKRFWSDSQNN